MFSITFKTLLNSSYHNLLKLENIKSALNWTIFNGFELFMDAILPFFFFFICVLMLQIIQINMYTIAMAIHISLSCVILFTDT